MRPHLRYEDYKKGISKRRKKNHGEQKKEKAVEKTETWRTEEGSAVEKTETWGTEEREGC